MQTGTNWCPFFLSRQIVARLPPASHEKLREMKDLEMLNGYSPDLEKKEPIPQVERELVVQVDQILEFKIAPHSDLEE